MYAAGRIQQGVQCQWHTRTLPCVHAQASQHEAGTRQEEIHETDMPRINRYNTPSIARRAARPAVSEYQTPSRPRAREPTPVPVIHSSAYQQTLVQNRMSPMGSMEEEPPQATGRTGTVMVRTRRGQDVLRSGNNQVVEESAIAWALRRADASLDELEANPTPIQKAVYGISRGPVGTATTNAVQAAARMTMKATVEAAKVAAPIGKWALAAGAKAAAQLIKAAVVEGVKAEGRRASKKDNGKQK